MKKQELKEDIFTGIINDLQKNHHDFSLSQRISYNLKLIDKLKISKNPTKELLEDYLSILLNFFEIMSLTYNNKEDTLKTILSRKHLFTRDFKSNIEIININLRELEIILLSLENKKNILSIKQLANYFNSVISFYFEDIE